MPRGMTTLIIACNRLGRKNGAELAQIFAAMPRGLTLLNLA